MSKLHANPKEYHRRITELAATLDEFPLLISEETQGGGAAGHIVECRRREAATWIIDKTHRLATPEEAATYRDKIAADRHRSQARASALELKTHTLQKGLLNLAQMDVNLPPELPTTSPKSAKCTKE